jgi:hypothetical protein
VTDDDYNEFAYSDLLAFLGIVRSGTLGQRVQRTVPTAAYDTRVRRRQPYVGGLLLAGP